jgi:hypothetical protein
MAIEILQYPASCSLAQSPIAFTVKEAETGSVASSSFQYVAELYYWTGSESDSGSFSDFTLAKYPNTELAGIFDVSKIINSTLQDVAQETTSSVQLFKVDFYHQYVSASTFVTSSHVETGIYKAIDGYSVFQEEVTQSLETKTPHWPIMSDGPATQSYFSTNSGRMSVWKGTGLDNYATEWAITGSDNTSFGLAISSSGESTDLITNFPIGPNQSDWQLDDNLPYFTVQAKNGNDYLGTPIRFNYECEKKYPNVRIKWKNRFGQFDYLNFNLVSEESFTTDIKTFQKQLGTWTEDSLRYNNYDSSTQNYSAVSTQTIKVNSDWLAEEYNDILKQLMVSDEIYWIYDETSLDLRPITIKTNSITFKTNVKDKLIQYAFDFEYGQSYKLIF